MEGTIAFTRSRQSSQVTHAELHSPIAAISGQFGNDTLMWQKPYARMDQAAFNQIWARSSNG